MYHLGVPFSFCTLGYQPTDSVVPICARVHKNTEEFSALASSKVHNWSNVTLLPGGPLKPDHFQVLNASETKHFQISPCHPGLQMGLTWMCTTASCAALFWPQSNAVTWTYNVTSYQSSGSLCSGCYLQTTTHTCKYRQRSAVCSASCMFVC